MTFAQAFADIALGFAGAFGDGPFFDAQVIDQVGAVWDDGGSIATPATPYRRDCSVQIDAATQRMREADGYTDKDMAFLVLADTLSGSLGTDAQIEVLDGPHQGLWTVSLIERDAVAIGWVGRGRKA